MMRNEFIKSESCIYSLVYYLLIHSFKKFLYLTLFQVAGKQGTQIHNLFEFTVKWESQIESDTMYNIMSVMNAMKKNLSRVRGLRVIRCGQGRPV